MNLKLTNHPSRRNSAPLQNIHATYQFALTHFISL
jgi:hypothetical protein